ncbi:unknown [Clostridium sp. CAG:813]|nr:unknown [Clostridium sp. CAG:813]
MNKKYIIAAIICFIIIGFLGWLIVISDEAQEKKEREMLPTKIGQKVWTYNMNKYQWREYQKTDDEQSKNEIILQVQAPEGNGGYTSYNLITGNAQVPKEDVWVGEGSQEFLKGKKLYSYYPRTFEYYEIIFNGVKFVPRKLSKDEIKTILKGYDFIYVSDLKKSTVSIPYSKRHNKFAVINDIGDNFYKYYIVPNDSKKMEIGDFSDQFILKDNNINIKLQRLEGCSKAYPCFDINVK